MERVQAVIAHPDFKFYMKQNKELETQREFCGHRWEHAVDVGRILYILYLEGQNSEDFSLPDELIGVQVREFIYAAGLLHDIGRWKQYQDPSKDHAVEGAILAGPILKEAGFSSEERRIIVSAIQEHRNPQARGLGKMLYQADKLSRHCFLCKARSRCYKVDSMETAGGIVY